jgi:Transposase
VPPAYAKPFRQGHKNDFRDAHAVAEAVQRSSTRCVPIKTDDQLDLQALHRVRSRRIGDRTAVINQVRGFLLEHGIAVRQGPRSAAAAATDSSHAHRRAIAPDAQDHWGHCRRLEISRRSHRKGNGRDRRSGTHRRELWGSVFQASARSLQAPRCLPSAMELPSRKGETFPLGLAWCRNRCRPAIARSLAASRSAETAICVCSSSKAPAPFCSTEELGKVQFRTLAHGCGAASASQHSDHRACQQAGADRFDRLGSRTHYEIRIVPAAT